MCLCASFPEKRPCMNYAYRGENLTSNILCFVTGAFCAAYIAFKFSVSLINSGQIRN